MEKLKKTNLTDSGQIRLAIDAALLLGFQTEAATFPVFSEEGTIPVPKTTEELENLWKLTAEPLPEGYEPASAHPGPIFDLDFRKEKGLEGIFRTGIFLKDEDHDLLPDRLDVKLVLPEQMDESILTAACNLAFRFGMETTGYEGSIVAEEGYAGNAVVFEAAEQTEMVLEERDGIVRVHLRGTGAELEEFTARICETFPQVNGMRAWRDVLLDMADDFCMRNADGQLAYLAANKAEHPGQYEVYGTPEMTKEQQEHFSDTTFYNYKSGRKVYEKTYELPWEVDTFEDILKEEVYPQLKQGDQVRVAGALSEDKKVRELICGKVKEAVEAKGAALSGMELICAYKQGFSWIDEVVIPAVQAAGEKPDRIEICFKPFLPEGQTEWLDENGATPSYYSFNEEDPERWFDLPIRYLQELYPIEDVLVEALGIEREQVVFAAYEGTEELTYLCRAVKGEETYYEASYQAQASERTYMDEYPDMGKVHPSTGYIQVWINGQEKLFRQIRTDLEEIWDIYQAEVLPDCKAYIEQKTGGAPQKELQPFFHELLLDVTASEPDYRVGCREDLISPLDALHEDMYFTGSDYFKNYGIKKINEVLDAPGLILPQIHSGEGRPVFKVTLFEQLKEKACILHGQDVVCEQKERDSVELKISRLSYEKKKIAATVQVSGVEPAVLKAYAALLEQGVLASGEQMGCVEVLRFADARGEICEAKVPQPKKLAKEKQITEIDLHEHELISYEMYREIIEELKQVPGIEVYRTARSYTGRELYAVWLKPEYTGCLSMTKRLTKYPSEIINARHHANEVSSTNAAFILLKKLLTEECYRELPDQLNLVLVPMENVDGAAIHYELQKEHPYWKFHVARFNSLGKEFYREHFQQDTIHSEAMGLTRLFERYVPDMIVDNHGVPSHEWEQQFSGYTSPSYKGFWLPRSLLYGYFWYVTDPEYKENYPVNKKMEDVIADKIAEDEEMTRWNQEWSAQFEKYAHAWMPKLFPADYYKNMINYWIPFAADPAHRYPSIRFPWITTVAYTSEVADETAQGEYLNLCARAHVAHDEATIQMLMQAKQIYACDCMCREERIFARYVRQRPMIV